jgi:hypothetical protein
MDIIAPNAMGAVRAYMTTLPEENRSGQYVTATAYTTGSDPDTAFVKFNPKKRKADD